MGKSKNKDQKTTTEPWAGQQPYLQDIFKQAQNLYLQGAGQQYYPGQTVAPFTPQVQAGLGMLEQGAMMDPVQMSMGNYLTGALSDPGGMAGVGMGMPGQNPYLDQMFGTVAQRAGEQFSEQALPALGAMFGGAGRTGSGLQAELAGNLASDFQRNLLSAGADIYGRDYERAMEQDIARRGLASDIAKAGILGAPGFQGMQQQNIQNMLQAGQITQGQAQQLIDADKARWDFSQQAPWAALGQYSQNVYGLPGGYGTTTGPGQGGGGGGLMGALGGASTAAGLGQALKATSLGPWALGGAVLGLL